MKYILVFEEFSKGDSSIGEGEIGEGVLTAVKSIGKITAKKRKAMKQTIDNIKDGYRKSKENPHWAIKNAESWVK